MPIKKNIKNSVLSLRLPVEIIEQLDALADSLKKEQPGINVTRADAARVLLLRGLEVSNIKK